MGHKSRVLGLVAATLLAAATARAQAPTAQVESQEPEPGQGAAAVSQPATQAGDETSISETLQIDLLDLEKLREQLEGKLVGEPMRITLEEAVRMALENNQDILIVGYEPAIADSGLLSARGDFDPNLSLSGSYAQSSRPPSPVQRVFGNLSAQNISTKTADWELTLSRKNRFGTQYGFDFLVDRERGTFTQPRDAMGNPLDPQSVYTADASLTLTQPLLRGFGTDSNLFRVRSAMNDQDFSNAQVQLVLINSIGQVIKSYWDLVGAVQQLTVRQEALANARRVLNINEQRYELGTASQLEVLEAKAGVARTQSDVVTARTNILDAEDRLKVFIGLYNESGELLSDKNLIPLDRPSVQTVQWDLDQSMRTALEYRPDIRQAELNIENAQLQVADTRDSLLPQVNLRGSYGRTTVNIGGGRVFEGLAEKDGWNWSVALEGSIPIGNRGARGAFQQAKLIKRQQEQQLIKTKQDAQLDVRLAIHSLASNRVLVESTQQARILEQANVDAEEKRLRIGVSTAQDVLIKQQDLTTAQAAEVQAKVDFEKALIDLRVAEGTLLRELGIDYEVPEHNVDIGFWKSLGPVSADD